MAENTDPLQGTYKVETDIWVKGKKIWAGEKVTITPVGNGAEYHIVKVISSAPDKSSVAEIIPESYVKMLLGELGNPVQIVQTHPVREA